MTPYQKSLLRIGIGVALLLCTPYLFSAYSHRSTQGTWDRLRAASACPSLGLAMIILYEGGKGVALIRQRRFGAWALAQAQKPAKEFVALPFLALVILIPFLPSRLMSLLCVSLVIAVPMYIYKHIRQWDSVTGHTVCEDCGYIVDGVESGRCPECGRRLGKTARAASFGRNILLR